MKPAPLRPPLADQADPDTDYVIGVDLGGTKIRTGIASADGVIIADQKIATSGDGGDVVKQITATIRELCAQTGANPERIIATGIGGAGVPNADGTAFTLAPNLTGLSGIPFSEHLAEELGHPVVIENDVNVAAIGELHYGLGRGHQDFVYLAVGTGIGMGIIAGGRLIRGARGAAGEIGYLPFGADPLEPANQVRGALEEVTAGDAIVRRYRDATGLALSPQEILHRASENDSAAITAFDDEARWIAAGLVAVRAVLDPEIVVLGGGIGSQAALIPSIASWLDRYGAPSLDLRVSELGHRAPVAGAVRLALETIRATQKGPVQ